MMSASPITAEIAPPTPTSTRATSNCSFVRPSPVETVARLQSANPKASRRGRLNRSTT